MKTRYIFSFAITTAMAGAALTQALHAQAKPKAYTIAEIEVMDAAKFKPYVDGTGVLVPQAGGRFLARGDKTFVIGGAPLKPLVVLIEWGTYDQAEVFFNSEANKKLIPHREAGSNLRAFVVEGK